MQERRPFLSSTRMKESPPSVTAVPELTFHYQFCSAVDLPNTGGLLRQVLSRLKTPAAVLGWGKSEEDMVQATSSYGHMVHAADWALNLATLTNYHFPNVRDLLPASGNQAPPEAGADGSCPQREMAVHTITFLMTDGDNIQWLLSDFATSPRFVPSFLFFLLSLAGELFHSQMDALVVPC